MSPRRTLAAPATLAGAGLFSGRRVSLRILPAQSGVGIAFRRADLPGTPAIPASIERLASSPERLGLPAALRARSTNLAHPDRPDAVVLTTEHILSALAGLGVTDATIELDAPEVPIGDGSARPFTEAILAAGIVDAPPASGAPLTPLTLRAEVRVADAAGPSIVALPREEPGCSFEYRLDYGPSAPLAPQTASLTLGTPGAADRYAREIAPARTFCLEAEARAMRAMGLFADLSPRDMLILGPAGPIDNALRFPDEPARHKLLDLIGDLALIARPLQARIVADRSGHALNQALARALLCH